MTSEARSLINIEQGDLVALNQPQSFWRHIALGADIPSSVSTEARDGLLLGRRFSTKNLVSVFMTVTNNNPRASAIEIREI
jgi:hypothetical protein